MPVTIEDKIIWSVNIAANHLLGKNQCLIKAAAVFNMLLLKYGKRHEGVSKNNSDRKIELVIGVSKGKDLFAHAWVESSQNLERRILIGDAVDLHDYQRLRCGK